MKSQGVFGGAYRPMYSLTPHQAAAYCWSRCWWCGRAFHLEELMNRHTYTYGILEGIGVCIGVPAKRGKTQKHSGGHSRQQEKAGNCYLWSAA